MPPRFAAAMPKTKSSERRAPPPGKAGPQPSRRLGPLGTEPEPPEPSAASPAPSPLEANRLGALWSTLDRALTATLADDSPSTAAILLWLHHRAPTGVVELARVVGLTQPACTRALDKLVQRGLVERMALSGKEVRLSLSTRGRAQARQLQQRRQQACAALLQALSTAEQAQFARLADKLLQAPVTDRAYARNVCRFCDHAVCDGPACPIGCRATALEREPGAT
jgi:DNA-binding MarR family transcriptional regulator